MRCLLKSVYYSMIQILNSFLNRAEIVLHSMHNYAFQMLYRMLATTYTSLDRPQAVRNT